MLVGGRRVETADAAGMSRALRCGRIEPLGHVGLFADGAAVRTVGRETFRLCQAHVDAMLTVTTDEVCEAIKRHYDDPGLQVMFYSTVQVVPATLHNLLPRIVFNQAAK